MTSKIGETLYLSSYRIRKPIIFSEEMFLSRDTYKSLVELQKILPGKLDFSEGGIFFQMEDQYENLSIKSLHITSDERLGDKLIKLILSGMPDDEFKRVNFDFYSYPKPDPSSTPYAAKHPNWVSVDQFFSSGFEMPSGDSHKLSWDEFNAQRKEAFKENKTKLLLEIESEFSADSESLAKAEEICRLIDNLFFHSGESSAVSGAGAGAGAAAGAGAGGSEDKSSGELPGYGA
jgi:hypothetical protein